jgi:hypothetical protein
MHNRRPGTRSRASFSKGRSTGPYLRDSDLIRLFEDYEISARVLRQAVNEELAKWVKEGRDVKGGEPVEIVPKKGPLGYAWPDLLTSSPGSEIDFYRINTFRRFYERSVYKLLTYWHGTKMPLPPETLERELKGLAKDAEFACQVGRTNRVGEDMELARERIRKVAAEVWKAYQDAVYAEPYKGEGEPREARFSYGERGPYVKKLLLPILQLAQLFATELPEIDQELNNELMAQSEN